MSDVVLITGAAGGIGGALAAAYRARGSRLILVDLDPDRIELRGDDVLTLACDVTDMAACADAVAQGVARFGRLDLLINNAGISHRSLFLDTAPEVIRRVFEVNVFGSIHMTRAALPALIEAHGHITVLSSVAGFAPLLGRTGYAASKHALHGFFDSLREELRDQGVGVTLVCPGYVDTPLRLSALDGSGRRVADKGVVAGRMMSPRAAADAIVRATDDGRHTAPITSVAKLSWVVSRVAPRAYAAIMRRAQASEFA